MKPEDALPVVEVRGADSGRMGTETLAPPLAVDWLLLEEKAEGKLEGGKKVQISSIMINIILNIYTDYDLLSQLLLEVDHVLVTLGVIRHLRLHKVI